MADYSEDYLLNKRIKIFQPTDGYRASTDAVLLAAAVNKIKNGDSVLDVGSGTGAISLCLAEHWKAANVKITGLEVQPTLAELANKSAEANGFETFLHFENCNIFEHKDGFCSFAHVISNPPYSENDLPSPNPSKATAHNYKQAGLAEWIRFCIKMIRPQGYFYMINRAEALEDILAALHGKLGEITIIPLYSKEGQTAKRVIVRARKDSKAPLIIRQPLIIHQADGSYSKEAHAVLREGAVLD